MKRVLIHLDAQEQSQSRHGWQLIPPDENMRSLILPGHAKISLQAIFRWMYSVAGSGRSFGRG
jgi:hypothetical protein